MSVTGHHINHAKECETRISMSLRSSVRKPHQYLNIPRWLSLVVSSSSSAFENGEGAWIASIGKSEDTLMGSAAYEMNTYDSECGGGFLSWCYGKN